MRTLVVVPTYDEKENLPAMEEALRREAPGTDLLVVDDNSPDGTGAMADALAAKRPGSMRVLHRPGKQGLGRAYLDGFRQALAAGYDAVVQMDCDFSHDPKDVPRLLAELEKGADLAIGSRYVPGGGTVNWGIGRQVISRGGSFYARTILRVPYRDLTGGFKAWKRSTLEAIALDEVGALGYGFQIEMTYRVHLRGKRIVEIPIVFVDRRVGQSKMSGGIISEAATLVWKIKRRVR